MKLRVFTYLRGRKVCPLCDQPLTARRRDAVAHPHCARELRRRRGEDHSGTRARATLDGAVEGGVATANGVLCPRCGGQLLLVRVVAYGPLSDAEAVLLAGHVRVSGRKHATCVGCEWVGTVARTREAAA